MNELQQTVILLQLDDVDKAQRNQLITQLSERLAELGQTLFLRKTPSLDVDSAGKDSDVLFNAGLDYLFLVSEIKQYGKATQPFLDNLDLVKYRFIIEEAEYLPPTHYLQMGKAPTAKPNNTFFVKISDSEQSINDFLKEVLRGE